MDRDNHINDPRRPAALQRDAAASPPRRLNLNVPERFGGVYSPKTTERSFNRYRQADFTTAGFIPQEEAPSSPAEQYFYPEQQVLNPQVLYQEGLEPAQEATGLYQPAENPPEDYESFYPQDDFSGVLSPQQDLKQPPRSRKKKFDRRALLERRASVVVIALLILCFSGMAAAMWLLPRSTESMIEKRELDKLPEFSFETYFSGDFTAGVAHYYTDTVPMRDDLKRIGSQIKSVFGLPKSEGGVKFVGNVNKLDQNKPAQSPSSGQSSAQPPESGTTPSSGEQPPVTPVGNNGNAGLEGAAGRHMDGATPAPADNPFTNQDAEYSEKNGIIIVKQDGHYRGLELFGGGSGESYAQNLNTLHSTLGDGVSIWSMPAPLACEFYTPKNYENYTANHSDCFDAIAAKLNPGIHSINVCPVLSQHVEEPIYCRTDHHWQPLGAYYAAQAFAQAAGVSFDDISTYKKMTREGFVGSLYSFAGDAAELLNDPEEFVYYMPGKDYQTVYYDTSFNYLWDEDDFFQEGAEGSDSYMIYLGGDQYIVKADTPTKNGRKLLVVKDSYGNTIPPFLVGSFEQIYVADMRYMERNLVSFIKDMGITDVLFTMSSYSLVGDAANNLETLMNQNVGETVTDDYTPGGGGEE